MAQAYILWFIVSRGGAYFGGDIGPFLKRYRRFSWIFLSLDHYRVFSTI
jgi:hypothetical protein